MTPVRVIAVVDGSHMNLLALGTIAPPQLVLGPGLAGIFLTPDEFDAIEDVDRNYRYELINGRLIVSPPPLEESSVRWPQTTCAAGFRVDRR